MSIGVHTIISKDFEYIRSIIMRDITITLTDDRKLGVLQCGDLNGFPCLYFQGFPGARLHALDFDKIAKQSGCCLIGVDRPGQGLSTFNHYTLSTWVDDI